MKRALRIIVPLLLAILLIACAAWYFLVYDQAFTKELLLSQARRFEDSGNYKISAFLYDVAYYQSSKDDAVAIELAQQYLDIGNYTKAEYTLSEAITANPSAELYVALSNVYVQQDKLLDAVNLLNAVTDPSISLALEAQRPQAPVMSPDPGFYSQYITVEVLSDGAALYVSTDADYPSLEKDAYAGPITLSSGETVIYALAVGDNGLVSQLTVSGYTVGGVIEEVVFTDAAAEAAIRAAAGADENDILFTDQLWTVTDLTVPAEAQSYEDLKYLPYLTSLAVESGSTGDLSILNELTRLQSLTLSGLRLTEEDMSLIAAHTCLTSLSLSGCSLSSISALEPLQKLTYLDLSGNTLRNISVISGMTGLKELYLSNNVVTGLESLAGLSALERLDISYNSVSTLEPLKDLANLLEVNASHNQISSTAGLPGLTKLETLDLSHNNLTDISALASLEALTELRCSNNALTTIAGFERLLKLRILDISYNQVAELPAFQASCELVNIDASHNLLLSVEALSGLPWLNTVNVDYNTEITDLLPLDKCPVLVRVNAYGTKVTEVSFLTAKSIIVNFDPTLEDE